MSKVHPEDFCDLCGGRNVVWHADNDLWNKVVEKKYHRGVIWCPICFIEVAEKQRIRCTSWRVSRDTDNPLVYKLRLELVKSQEEIEGFKNHIKLLQECDDNSTRVIKELVVELNEQKSKNK